MSHFETLYQSNKLHSCNKQNNIFFQPRLTINQPNDIYEQEADAMAEKVMQIPANENHFFRPATNSIQKKCDHCAEEEKQAQRRADSLQSVEAGSEISSYVNSLSSKGSPLPNESIEFFGPKFGYDFSNLRIHNDTEAISSAQSINALAYTSGNNIVFNQNQFSPATDDGKKLLAHELTHVVQQTGNIQTKRLPCKTFKSIDVYTISLPGSTRDTFSDVAFANTILCQCGLALNIVGGESWSTDLMDMIPPKNVLNEYSSPGSPTTEEVEMLSHQPGTQALHMYFVPALSGGSEAESFWTSAFPTVSNGVAVADNARSCAVAHEIGHVLLDDGSHHPNKDNLMASGSINTCAGELEQSQCNKM